MTMTVDDGCVCMCMGIVGIGVGWRIILHFGTWRLGGNARFTVMD